MVVCNPNPLLYMRGHQSDSLHTTSDFIMHEHPRVGSVESAIAVVLQPFQATIYPGRPVFTVPDCIIASSKGWLYQV